MKKSLTAGEEFIKKKLITQASKMKIGILGANGFIGSNLDLHLRNTKKFKVYCLSSFNKYKARWVKKILHDIKKYKPDIIINFAAQGEGAVSWRNSWRFFETNSMALSRLCEELMKRNWLERFIQIGTSEMYGSVNHPVKEDEPIKPSSPYAASKVAFDLYLVSVFKNLNFPMKIFLA